MPTQLQAPGTKPRVDRRTFRANSKHFLRGRKGRKVRKLILHNTETAEGGNAPSGPWLSINPASSVSIHHLYGRDGTRYDIVDRADTAYHSGSSAWGDLRGDVDGVGVINLVSIGHELESSTTKGRAGNGYTDAQYESLGYTLATEIMSYGLQWADVLDHGQVAIPAGRRSDPSRFDRPRLERIVNDWLLFLSSLPPEQLAEWCI